MTSQISHIKKILIANRGEIACRLIKGCKDNSIHSIAIFSKEDCLSPHVNEAYEAHLLPGTGSQAYLDTETILNLAKDTNADGVIPGYGFLSENHEFAQTLEKLGIKFIGPSPEVIEKFGLKHIARKMAMEAEVPVVPGTGLISTADEAIKAGETIGYPVLLKASAGGGGMGMKVCHMKEEVESALAEVQSRSSNLFHNSAIFLEKYIESGRHIEVQVFGNGLGDILVLGERECSIQRRHQKVIEESPSPFIDMEKYNHKSMRNELSACASRLAASVKYKSAGTIEFLVDDKTGDYYFLEMNTRLQVEHGITELTYNVDIVTMMLLQADYECGSSSSSEDCGGIPGPILSTMGNFTTDNGWAQPSGHAIEVRIYAENPIKNFSPAPGILQSVKFPSKSTTNNCVIRFDHWIRTGTNITPYFDPLLGKLMVWAPTRQEATNTMLKLLQDCQINGPPNNLEYLHCILSSSSFQSGTTLTSTLESFEFHPTLLDFESSGAFTTVQDLPGRVNYNGGIPKGGPLDELSFVCGNSIVGNDVNCEALEIIFNGPSLKFYSPATIALCGAAFDFKINGQLQPLWTAISIPKGSKVEIGRCSGSGDKAYLAIKGGLPNIAKYLGSKSCSPGINIGGYQGRRFLAGDCITLPEHGPISKVTYGYSLPEKFRPKFSDGIWTIRCLNGPHSSAEIVSDEGRDILYGSEYTVNPNSTRGSIALDGPKCLFSRPNGGDGGNHPSNVVEYIYPYRGISTVADGTVAAGPDGITLSGFISPIVPIESDWWKLGQANIGSKIKFQRVSYEDAMKLRRKRGMFVEFLASCPEDGDTFNSFNDTLEHYQIVSDDDVILFTREEKPGMPIINIRQAGESSIIVDHDVSKFSLANCGRLYKMMLDTKAKITKGLLRTETANGSLTVFFSPEIISRDDVIKVIIEIDNQLSFNSELKIPSRVFKLPVCMDHRLIRDTIEKYMKTQRPYAAYLPSNLDYVMKSSCIDTIEEFKSRAFNNPQVVVAVSFLCASTIMVHKDPRMSFISGKYNPPRTSGPAGSITTGSVVQGMRAVDGPGGYMLWGAGLTKAYWDTYAMRKNFNKGLPWFLEPFDQIEFYEVSEDKIDQLNELNIIGKYNLNYESTTFDLREYYKFLESIKLEVAAIRSQQGALLQQLLEEDNLLKRQWEQEIAARKAVKKSANVIVSDSTVPLTSTAAASVFKISVEIGDIVKGGSSPVVLEAMKTEIPVVISGTKSYKVVDVVVEEKTLVSPDDILLQLEELV